MSTAAQSCAPSSAAAAARAVRLRLALVVVLLVAAALRLWDLGGHEYDNLYYAAAVQSMSASWRSFLYAAFDPAGFVAVDKPPIAFWFQVLSVKLLGYSPLSLHLPQALTGVAAVAVVYHLTARVVSSWGGLVAGLVLAVMPVSVAVDRSNLPDSCLVLALLLAAWAMLRATETGRWRWVLLSTALVGVAFNVKMLAAYLVLPALYSVYLLGSTVTLRRRLSQLAAASAVLIVVSLAWATIVDLTPPQRRPYVGGTQNNSMLELALGFNGLRRIGGFGERPHGPGPNAQRPMPGPAAHGGPHPGPPPSPMPGQDPGAVGPPGLHGPMSAITGFGGQPGPLRLLNREMAGQSGWLLPFVLVSLAGCAARLLRHLPRTRFDQALWLWSAWFLTCAVVFSLSRGVIHNYYLSLLAPAIAVLAGLGVVHLHEHASQGGLRLLQPLAAIVLTAAWHAFVVVTHTPWATWLVPLLVCGLVLSTTLIVVAAPLARLRGNAGQVRVAGYGLGLATLLICPTIWSATPALAPTDRMIPVADPILLDYAATRADAGQSHLGTERLVSYLRENRRGEQFILAVGDIHLAAPLIIESGEAVMACGGFRGVDPILTPERFAALVDSGRLRYVLLAGPGPFGDFPAAIEAWVRKNGTRVPQSEWAGKTQDQLLRQRPRMHPPWGPIADMIRSAFDSPGLELYDCQTSATARP